MITLSKFICFWVSKHTFCEENRFSNCQWQEVSIFLVLCWIHCLSSPTTYLMALLKCGWICLFDPQLNFFSFFLNRRESLHRLPFTSPCPIFHLWFLLSICLVYCLVPFGHLKVSSFRRFEDLTLKSWFFIKGTEWAYLFFAHFIRLWVSRLFSSRAFSTIYFDIPYW